MHSFSGLDDLLRHDREASDYFTKLPDYVREQIASRANGVNSLASLMDYAENLTRGDG